MIGDEIIESPMCWRSRYFEGDAYRSLFKEYFRGGARWTSAPRPQLTDELYNYDYRVPNLKAGEPMQFTVNEFEPVFDAADFVRCGRDLFVTRSNVTNLMGIEWLRRHLGPGFRIHEIESRCPQPMHIDSSFMPLAPGKVLVNPDYIDVEKLPAVLKKWDVLIAPRPDPVEGFMSKISMCSPWTSINVLAITEKKIVVDASQPTLIKALKDWGFDPIPAPFLSYGPFGGSFHCATLDVRRRGVLILGSGNIVHNLRAMRLGRQPYDWASAFDASFARNLEARDLAASAADQQPVPTVPPMHCIRDLWR